MASDCHFINITGSGVYQIADRTITGVLCNGDNMGGRKTDMVQGCICGNHGVWKLGQAHSLEMQKLPNLAEYRLSMEGVMDALPCCEKRFIQWRKFRGLYRSFVKATKFKSI